MCPHHACHECGRKSSAAGLVFRCEICPLAYCEDCLPQEAFVIGPSERMEALGYRQNNICYMHCSLECAHAAVELIPSLQLGLVSSTIGDLEAMARVNPLYNVASTEKTTTSSSSNTLQVFNSSVAIENCLLSDARARLERDRISPAVRFLNLKEITNFEDRWKEAKDSTKKILKVILILSSLFSLKLILIFKYLIDTIVSMDPLAKAEHGTPNSKATTKNDDEENEDGPYFDFAGVKAKNNQNVFYEIFIKLSRKLTEVSKIELIRLARLLPIVYG